MTADSTVSAVCFFDVVFSSYHAPLGMVVTEVCQDLVILALGSAY